jgi:hypothetical protein
MIDTMRRLWSQTKWMFLVSLYVHSESDVFKPHYITQFVILCSTVIQVSTDL